jgi:hypothetical protein
MILLDRNIDLMSETDIEDTLLYCRRNLTAWKDFRNNSDDFQMRQTADNNSLIAERKIVELTQNRIHEQ